MQMASAWFGPEAVTDKAKDHAVGLVPGARLEVDDTCMVRPLKGMGRGLAVRAERRQPARPVHPSGKNRAHIAAGDRRPR